jgi:hypothetical protein
VRGPKNVFLLFSPTPAEHARQRDQLIDQLSVCFGFEARLLFVNKNNNKHFASVDAFVGDKIYNDRNRSGLLFFDAGALDVGKMYGADYVRAT